MQNNDSPVQIRRSTTSTGAIHRTYMEISYTYNNFSNHLHNIPAISESRLVRIYYSYNNHILASKKTNTYVLCISQKCNISLPRQQLGYRMAGLLTHLNLVFISHYPLPACKRLATGIEGDIITRVLGQLNVLNLLVYSYCIMVIICYSSTCFITLNSLTISNILDSKVR